MENQNQPSPASVSDSKPLVKPVIQKQNPVLVILIILVIVLLGSTVYLAYENMWLQNKITKTQAVSTPATFSTVTPTITPQANVVNITLPVTVLHTDYGAGPANQTYPYESSINVSVPQEFSTQLGAYGVADMVIIGPKGWTGSGSVGADGTSGTKLYPIGGSSNSANISISTGGACVGCVYDKAAPYFPEARQLDAGMGISSNLVSTPPPGIISNFINPQLVEYSLPNTTDGMEVNGVANFVKGTQEMPNQPYSINFQITLPLQQHNLTQELLNIFIQGQKLQ